MKKLTAILFVIVGLGCIAGGLFFAYDTQKKMQTWVEVEGTVVEARAVENPIFASAEVTYLYFFGGKVYRTTIDLGVEYRGGSAFERARKKASTYVIGSSRQLSVNPSNPREISHALGYNFGTFWGVLLFFALGLAFSVIGIIVMKPPKLKVSADFPEKFIPRAFIVIGIGLVAGALFSYVNNPRELLLPIILGLIGLYVIIIPILFLRNVARGTAKTQRIISVVRSGKHAITKAKGIADVLYSPAKRHTNTEEQFLKEVARFGAHNMDKIGRSEKVTQINIWAEGNVPSEDGSRNRIWKGIKLTLDKGNWGGPMIGDLSNLAALDQWQYFKNCSFHYVSKSEFPKWPKMRSGPG